MNMSEFSNKIREVLEVFRAKGEYDALSKDLDILIDLCDAVWRDGNWQDRENTVFFFHDNHALSENIPVEILENWAVDVLRSGKFQGENRYVRFYDLLQWVKKPSRKLIGLALVYILGLEISPANKYIEFKKWILKSESSFKYELDTAKEIEKLSDEFSQLGLSLTDIVQRQFFVLAMRFYYERGSFLDITDRDIENWRYAVRNKSSKIKDPLFDEFFPTQVEIIEDYIQSKNLGAIHRLFDRGFLKDEDGKFLPNDVLWGCIRIFYDNDVERAGRETFSILVFWVMERLDDKNNPIPLDVIQWMLTSGLEYLRELNFEAANKVYRGCISRIENVEGETSGLFFLAGQIPTSIYEASSRNRQLFLLALFDKTKRKNRSEKDYLSEVDVRELHSILESSNDKYKEWGEEVFESAKENNWIRPEKEKPKDFHPSDTAPGLVGYKKFVSRYLHSHAPEDIWTIMEAIPEVPLPIQFSSFLNWMEEAKDNIKDIASEKPQQSAAADPHNLNWFQRLKKWFISLVAKNRKQSESGAPQARGEKSHHDHWVDLVKILNADSGYLYNKSITSVVRSLFHQIDERFLLMSIGTFLLHGNSVNALSAEDVAELAKINIKRFDGLLPLSLVAQLSPYLLKTPYESRHGQKHQILPQSKHEKTTVGETHSISRLVWVSLGAIVLFFLFLTFWMTGASENVRANIAAAKMTRENELVQTMTPVLVTVSPTLSATPTFTPSPALSTIPVSMITGYQDWDTSTLLLYSRPTMQNNAEYEIAFIDKAIGPSVLPANDVDFNRPNCDSVDWPFLNIITLGSQKIPRLNSTCYNSQDEVWYSWFSDLTPNLSVKDDNRNYLDSSVLYVTSRFRWTPDNKFGIQLVQNEINDKPKLFHLYDRGFYSLGREGGVEIANTDVETEIQIAPEILAYDWITLAPVNNSAGKNVNENKGRLLFAVNEAEIINLYDVWVQYGGDSKPEIYKANAITFGDFKDIYDIDVSADGDKLLVVGLLINTDLKTMRIYDLSGGTDEIIPSLMPDSTYQPSIVLDVFDEISQISWSPDLERRQIAIAGKIMDPSKLPQSNETQGITCEMGCLFFVDTETLKTGQEPKLIWIKNITSGIQHFWWTQWPQ